MAGFQLLESVFAWSLIAPFSVLSQPLGMHAAHTDRGAFFLKLHRCAFNNRDLTRMRKINCFLSLPLLRDDLPVDTVELARFMIGKYLVHDLPEGRMSGRIVETEAYPLGDSTSHAFIGRRPHNGSMFLAPGHAYVRLTYGLSYMLNMSAEARGGRRRHPVARDRAARRPAADGSAAPRRAAARSRARTGPSDDGVRDRTSHSTAGICARDAGLWIGVIERGDTPIGVTTRIGLSREMHRPLRFFEPGSAFVSGPRKLLLTPHSGA